MKKRKIMLGSAVMLAVLLVVGGTMAWFTATAPEVTNTFEAGTVEIELIDKMYDKDGQIVRDNEQNPITKITNVNPGDCYKKEVAVKNTGSKKAMVRVHESTLITDFKGATPTSTPNINIVKFTVNENWEYDATTQHFYYKTVLDPNATTEPILVDNKICFDGALMGNEYQGATFDIKVEAEAIQATNEAPTTAGWKFDPLATTTP